MKLKRKRLLVSIVLLIILLVVAKLIGIYQFYDGRSTTSGHMSFPLIISL